MLFWKILEVRLFIDNEIIYLLKVDNWQKSAVDY